jgi:hypothetical protein
MLLQMLLVLQEAAALALLSRVPPQTVVQQHLQHMHSQVVRSATPGVQHGELTVAGNRCLYIAR